MPRAFDKPDDFRRGDRKISARDLNKLKQSIQRQLIGGQPLNVQQFGDRQTVRYDEEPIIPNSEIQTFYVMYELDDYLLCYPIMYGYNAQPNMYNGNPLTVPGIIPNQNTLIAVAKPWILQRTPWDGKVVEVSGVLYQYHYISVGVRQEITLGGSGGGSGSSSSVTTEIDVPYFVGDIITARRGASGYFVDINGDPIVNPGGSGAGIDSAPGPDGYAIAVVWNDLNVQAREWESSGGGVDDSRCSTPIRLVTNICLAHSSGSGVGLSSGFDSDAAGIVVEYRMYHPDTCVLDPPFCVTNPTDCCKECSCGATDFLVTGADFTGAFAGFNCCQCVNVPPVFCLDVGTASNRTAYATAVPVIGGLLTGVFFWEFSWVQVGFEDATDGINPPPPCTPGTAPLATGAGKFNCPGGRGTTAIIVPGSGSVFFVRGDTCQGWNVPDVDWVEVSSSSTPFEQVYKASATALAADPTVYLTFYDCNPTEPSGTPECANGFNGSYGLSYDGTSIWSYACPSGGTISASLGEDCVATITYTTAAGDTAIYKVDMTSGCCGTFTATLYSTTAPDDVPDTITVQGIGCPEEGGGSGSGGGGGCVVCPDGFPSSITVVVPSTGTYTLAYYPGGGPGGSPVWASYNPFSPPRTGIGVAANIQNCTWVIGVLDLSCDSNPANGDYVVGAVGGVLSCCGTFSAPFATGSPPAALTVTFHCDGGGGGGSGSGSGIASSPLGTASGTSGTATKPGVEVDAGMVLVVVAGCTDDRTVTSVTFNGIALTSAIVEVLGVDCEIWYLHVTATTTGSIAATTSDGTGLIQFTAREVSGLALAVLDQTSGDISNIGGDPPFTGPTDPTIHTNEFALAGAMYIGSVVPGASWTGTNGSEYIDGQSISTTVGSITYTLVEGWQILSHLGATPAGTYDTIGGGVRPPSWAACEATFA